MLNGVDFAVHDVGQAAVDGQGGAVFYTWRHAVAEHGRADGLVGVDVHGLQDGGAQADLAVHDLGHMGLA